MTNFTVTIELDISEDFEGNHYDVVNEALEAFIDSVQKGTNLTYVEYTSSIKQK